MKFAYLILAHDKPNQLKYFISLLDKNDNKIFVHIDKKVDINIFYSDRYSDNVIFLTNRHIVSWGMYSMIEATLELFKTYLNSGFIADYIHLLSGQCLPLKEDEVIKNYFIKNNGKLFIDYFLSNDTESRLRYKWNGAKKIDVNYLYDETKIYYKASQWFSITNESLLYLYKECTTNDNLINFYRHAKIPDENYFQNVLIDSKFKDNIIPSNLRHIEWGNGTNNHHPKTLSLNIIEQLRNTDVFCGRKFDLGIG